MKSLDSLWSINHVNIFFAFTCPWRRHYRAVINFSFALRNDFVDSHLFTVVSFILRNSLCYKENNFTASDYKSKMAIAVLANGIE